MADLPSHLFSPFFFLLPYLTLPRTHSQQMLPSLQRTTYIHKHKVSTTSSNRPNPYVSCPITSQRTYPNQPLPPSHVQLSSLSLRHLRLISPVTCSQGLRRRRRRQLKIHTSSHAEKKAVCCVVCPIFKAFLERKKKEKEEARLSLYHRYLPPVLFCFSLFGFGLATATLLRYYIAYFLSFSFSRISV